MYHIFAGRFQPFHIGHLEIVKQAISNLESNDILVIAVIKAYNGIAVDADFASKATEHHGAERNPWFPCVPLRAITKLIESLDAKNQIITTILPCPDTSWLEITKWFPHDRKWIIPSAGEAFDEVKAKFYISQGEKVIRYTENTNVSGWQLRDCLYKSDYQTFKQFIPEEIVEIYWNGERQ